MSLVYHGQSVLEDISVNFSPQTAKASHLCLEEDIGRQCNKPPKYQCLQWNRDIQLKHTFQNGKYMSHTFYHTPGIDTTPKLATFGLHLYVTSNHCKWDAPLQGPGKVKKVKK